MKVFDRLKMGIVLTKDSLAVIRHYPRLILFPALSGLAGLAFLGVFLGVTFGASQLEPEGGVLVGLFLLYLGLTFISSFFTAALVQQTRQSFDGNPVSLGEGMRAAWAVKRPIFVWSLVAATVGVIINALENSNSTASRIVGTLFGLAWTVLTFLIIPTIVFERTSMTGMFKRSGELFKQTWGETPISLVAINIVAFLVALPAVVLGFAAISVDLVYTGIAIIFVGVLAGFLLSQTLQGVLKTALYVYATEGKIPSEFDNVDMNDLPGDQRPRRGAQSGPGMGGGFH